MQEKTNIEKLNDFWLRVVGIPVTGLLTQFTFYKEDSVKYNYPLYRGLILTTLITMLLWETGRQVLIYYRNKYPNINQTKERVLFSFAGFLLNSIVINVILHGFYNYFLIWNHKLTFKDYLFNVWVAVFFIVFLYSIYEMIYYFRKWKQTFDEREKLQAERLHNHLKVLQSQINPHFLFNSLNILEMLAEEKHDNTAPFVRHLANVYRYILQNQEKNLNSVKEELDFIKAYSFLLETRFGDNLKLKIDVPEQYHDKLIPPLTLQLLVENAMKHNVVSASKPLTIDILTEDSHYLVIKNNLQKKTQFVPSNKVGLENIKQRYALFNHDAVKILTENNAFIVAIPMLEASLQVETL
jgi:sensor histidine kinase YesM